MVSHCGFLCSYYESADTSDQHPKKDVASDMIYFCLADSMGKWTPAMQCNNAAYLQKPSSHHGTKWVISAEILYKLLVAQRPCHIGAFTTLATGSSVSFVLFCCFFCIHYVHTYHGTQINSLLFFHIPWYLLTLRKYKEWRSLPSG